VVDVDDHAAVHHLLDEVAAEAGQPASVADLAAGVDRQHRAGRQAHDAEAQQPHEVVVDQRLLVVGRAGATGGGPPVPGGQQVAQVDERPADARVEPGAAEGVVELVHRVETGDAQ
jgi:hypothetical protein